METNDRKAEADARSRQSFLFSSSRVFMAPGEEPPPRPDLQMSLIVQSKAAQHRSNGDEAMGTSQYEKAVVCFSKAINLQPEQARLHESQAEAYLQLCDFQSAAACYKRAGMLAPGRYDARLAFVYFLQGHCLFDRGLFLEALQAFSRAVQLKPGCRTYEVKSLSCLAAAGHATDGLKLVTDWMLLDGPTSDLYLLRARLYQLLRQMTRCHEDVRCALALAPHSPQAASLLLQLQDAAERHRREAVDAALSGRLPDALSRANMALENCPRDARLYLFRGFLYRRLKDFTAAIEDLVQAVELSEEEEEEKKKEKEVRGQTEAGEQQEEGQEERGSMEQEAQLQLVLTYNDFAVECFSRGLYAEATLLLNRAVQEERGRAGLYLNRGDCFFRQGEWCFALADYQQAQEMLHPGDPAARLRLAVLHSTLGAACFQDGCFQEAVDLFSLALLCDASSARYYEFRSKAFRKLANPEAARRDLVCTLVLDPGGDELPAMLMDLFPGLTAEDVLSSSTGQAVRAQLMENIKTCSAAFDQQSLSEDLLKMTLTNQNTGRRPADPSEVGRELKLCVSQEETQIILRNCFQPSTTPRPRDLHHTPAAPAAPAAAAVASVAPPAAAVASIAPAAPVTPVEQDQSTFTHSETDLL
ncbi:tetratricopeptide repeat protein 16 isoform X2 [Clinocottus analis]|uniref:tetratricopeptide repeat protein 16 isoform X2 n=1 Tax=Clinocottus analis TaxID=304258 RepID=UPI0035C1E0B9